MIQVHCKECNRAWSEGVSDRFYVLDCDRCGKTLGWTTNAAFPMCGLTRCTDCMREAIA
ncbi:hypothetical protein DOROTHY_85 [Mycobacterium phage Dorothy]|uniref:Uncharacterized protein n=6 Tax=Gracegardnervirinae TaxID=2946632 RepID=A0A7D5FM80_9CAUD|nr:hypothetical protein HAMULUS_86 [Mycobacterium phage Hamulus]YP_009125363.1 hypothetical protein VC69_gp082 [Mycobacterium phage Inventum]YP_009592060.1 hypothetical protein FDG65_gp085 [Mycobacterium phage Dorothy]YP_009958325.1 hypothetical protein I5H49_gp088 [Mycobacterium phage JoeyJr]YP_009963901.1 hypothetical protein I5I03_gp086 [Mycobacterium phage Soul22]QHB47379.1 hypothetical protein SEA_HEGEDECHWINU_94 [Mycobacterium phage Hegedechwinu]QIQ63776.1 hypothetical protein SEA_PHANP